MKVALIDETGCAADRPHHEQRRSFEQPWQAEITFCHFNKVGDGEDLNPISVFQDRAHPQRMAVEECRQLLR